MSDTEDLYNISVSPPPQSNSRPEWIGSSGKNQARGKLPRPQSFKRAKGMGDIRDYTRSMKTVPHAAPTAKMIATPPKDRSNALQTPTSNRSTESKVGVAESSPPVLRSNLSKGKEAMDYQAEVDAVEAARDRTDPDFNSSQDTITVHHKKRKKSYSCSSPSARAKQRRSQNRVYAKCSDQVKERRDQHIARIVENWGKSPDQCIPSSIIPSATKLVKGKRYERQPRDPRDWDDVLLSELAYFSSLTTNRLSEARKTLLDIVSEKVQGGGVPELLATDVKHAIHNLGRITASESADTPATSFSDPPPEAVDPSVEQLLNEATAGIDENEYPLQLLSPRSSTVGREVVVKQEPRSTTTAGPSTGMDEGWNGYDAELERLEELDLQYNEEEAKLAVAKAQRERFQQRKRMRELARQHGNSQQDAILITAEMLDG